MKQSKAKKKKRKKRIGLPELSVYKLGTYAQRLAALKY